MRLFIRGIIAAVIVALVAGGFCLYQGISTSLQAEYALHGVLLTIQLLDEHVTTHEGDWPNSWTDLEELPPRSGGMYEWPRDSSEIQKCVEVDFGADPQTLARQSAEKFDAVRPIGPCYPFDHYGFLQNLLDSLRRFHSGEQ